MNSAKDPLHYAVAAITLVSATNNSINFTGIFPTTVAAGSTYADIYLNAENLLNSTQIFFIPPGQSQGLPIVSTNIYTIPISIGVLHGQRQRGDAGSDLRCFAHDANRTNVRPVGDCGNRADRNYRDSGE